MTPLKNSIGIVKILIYIYMYIHMTPFLKPNKGTLLKDFTSFVVFTCTSAYITERNSGC